MKCKGLHARTICGIISLAILHARKVLPWRHTSAIFDISLLYRFQFEFSIIRECQVRQQPLTAFLQLMRPLRDGWWQANEANKGCQLGSRSFFISDPKYNRKSHGVCNWIVQVVTCALWRTQKMLIDGDWAKWEINYRRSKSTSKLNKLKKKVKIN